MSSMPDAVATEFSPISEATATEPLLADTQSHRWPPSLRIAFRFAFCYVAGYCLCNGNATIFDSIPKYGDKVQEWLANVLILPAQYMAQHVFHVPPPGNAVHPTGSGDTAINWIATLVLFTVSLIAAAVWSGLDRRRPHYQTLFAWLRFLARLTIGFGMVTYGFAKIFPLQMPVPSMLGLSEPLGMHSPMNVLWSFIGINPVYEMICGSAELIAGLLILFRRTALLGSLVTAFVVTNILLYNLCFDVPVKLYAGHLLLLSLFIAIPDVAPLYRFFVLHQPAAPTGVWVPPFSRPAFRRATYVLEVAFAILSIGGIVHETWTDWRGVRESHLAACPLRGAWHIDTATLAGPNGTRVDHPVLSPEKHPFSMMGIETTTRAGLRDDNGRAWGFGIKTDTTGHTLRFTRPDDSTITYAVATPDPRHMTLTPTGSEAATASTMTLSLVSPPNGYPLLTRGFHWVSEYPYQR